MSDEKIDQSGPETATGEALDKLVGLSSRPAGMTDAEVRAAYRVGQPQAEAPPAPKVHVGIGRVVEKGDGGRRGTDQVPNLAASRRCLATIPENLNDIWWRDAKVDKPVDRELVLFHVSTGFTYTGARLPALGVFIWSDGDVQMSDAEVTHWMPQPSKPK